MDFDEYVTARRSTLVRVAALLGCPEPGAARLVHDVLTRSARQVLRDEDPDPEVYRALMSRIVADRPGWAATTRLPEEDATNAAGLAVRRRLAALPTSQRDAAVLLHHADLTLYETAEALRAKPAVVSAWAVEATEALGAVDSEHAADQVQRAAGTIDVPPADPFVLPPGPRRWPWVTAAAAVAVTAAAVALTTGPAPKDDGRLDADQIPSLFGYDAEGARELLAGLGLEVAERPSRSCDVYGRVLASEPATGARFDEGDTVTIRTAALSDLGCMAHYQERDDAWVFVDFANGRGPAPEFADRVYLVANGSQPEAITASAAADPSGWGGVSALKELRAISARVVRENATTYVTPTMTSETLVPPAQTCGVERPIGAGRRTALRISIDVAVEGPAHCPLTVDVYRSSNGIDAVVLYTEKSGSELAGAALSPPPWVTGRRR